ncbi:MAG: fimbria/pilus outer membrane usher protein [Escherichia coli]
MAFRGVQLSSSESMLPDSQRGFAPTIPRRRTQLR